VPLSTAHADTWEDVALSLPGYYQMAVDNKHDQLFFSEGSNAERQALGQLLHGDF
jgi:hypothetical protein